MKLEFDRMANGGYVIDLKANSDFNLHLERMSNEEDVYIYVRGSSEGEYKFYKKVFGKVVDMDFDIPEAIVAVRWDSIPKRPQFRPWGITTSSPEHG